MGRYCGLTLDEWRGSVRAILRSQWHTLGFHPSTGTPADNRHSAVLMSATLLLPTKWHKANAHRLSPDFYVHRRAYLALWNPRLKGGANPRHER